MKAENYQRNSFQSFSPDGVLICTHTGAFGADIEGVSLVFHLEGAHSPISFCQTTGRCGRDGSPEVAIFKSNTKLLNKCAADEQVMQLELSQQCKRSFLSDYFDEEGAVFFLL
jgi:superfamily II DNA helicase RecQ